MSDQIPKTQAKDDASLIELFKNFETILTPKKEDIDWSIATDFHVFSEFLIKDIQEMQERLKNANDEYYYYVCRHIFNIQDWIKLIVENAGFPTFGKSFEVVFDKHFKDKQILQNMYDVCFEKWIAQKNGQWKIGENFYNILEGKLYYHNRFGQWFEADRKTVFDLKPNQKLIENNNLIDQLNDGYKETWYDAIIKKWKNKQYQGVLPDHFLKFDEKETSPEAYSDFTIGQIKTLLKNPVSVAELERWSGDEDVDLEHIVKITALVLGIAAKRRKDDSHTIYLLRDSLMFYEAHEILDILSSKDTSADQILIGRRLLTQKSNDRWAYYVVTLECLYVAHQRYPTNFSEFYNEYARLMDMFVSLNPGFATRVSDLADYIKEHLRTDKKKIIIFDIGFQGSIAILVKYIIDRHIMPTDQNGQMETDIKLSVGAQWSKKLFGDRYENDYFPFLNRTQLMARSDELYHYKHGSLNSGKIRVVMGDSKWQHKAAIELVVLVMVALSTQEDNLL